MARPAWKLSSAWLWRIASGVAALLLIVSAFWWYPRLTAALAGRTSAANAASAAHDHDHGGHGATHDDHAGHDHGSHAETIELSEQAKKNIGLTVADAEVKPYSRDIVVPAVVTERPGETHYILAAPMTGIVTGLAVVSNEALRSGEVVCRIRLTHEDLVEAQAGFLAMLEERDVERKDFERLQGAASGAIARKVLIEKEHDLAMLDGRIKARRGALLLHGLTPQQIETIVDQRELIREVIVSAPFLHDDSSLHDDSEPEDRHPVPVTSASLIDASVSGSDLPHDHHAREFVVHELPIKTGSAVAAGDPLCVLADLSELYIEGRAYEQDADAIIAAATRDVAVTAVVQRPNGQNEHVPGLSIVTVSNEVDSDSRTLSFYLGLDNEVVRDTTSDTERRFLTWRFKPGQRMQLRIPIETFDDSIVLPIDALAEDGPERYVFVENGRVFERRAVHVRYRDRESVVIANDGSLFPGTPVATSGAHQLQLAIKNAAGGGVDPHAGHNH